MFELLVRLECAREALRRRLLKSSDRHANSYFGIAIAVVGITLLTGPAEFVIVPFVGIPVALVLFIVGLVFVLSIVGLGAGVFLW